MEQLPGSHRGNLPLVLRITGYLDETLGLVRGLDEHRTDIETIMRPPVEGAIADYQAAVVTHIGQCDAESEAFSMGALDASYEDLRAQWHELKSVLLDAAAARSVPVNPLNSALEGLRSYLKMAEQLTKTAERLSTLGVSSDMARAQPRPLLSERSIVTRSVDVANARFGSRNVDTAVVDQLIGVR